MIMVLNPFLKLHADSHSIVFECVNKDMLQNICVTIIKIVIDLNINSTAFHHRTSALLLLHLVYHKVLSVW